MLLQMDEPRREQPHTVPRRAWRRAARLYQALGVVLLSATLVTAVLLLAVHLVYPLEHSFWMDNLGGRRLSDTLVPGNYYLSGAEETGEIRRNWDEYVLAGHWRVHPWTGLINREFASRHLNIDAHGRRRTGAPDAKHAGLPPVEVWAFGGSTLFGWGLPDRHTIPSQLQVTLQKRLPDAQVRVTNFGVPWYNSSHELALFAANLREAARPPAAAVFLDGTNDLVHSVHYHSDSPLNRQLAGAWEDRLGAIFAPPPWLRILPSFPLARVARALGGGGEPTLGGLPDPAGDKPSQEWTEHAATTYGRNHRLVAALADEAGVQAYFFLEPASKWLNEARDTTTDPTFRAFYELVLRDGESRIHDLRAGLAALSAERSMTVEETGTHYSDAAALVLAEAIAEALAPGLSSYRP